ncbi:hypothetical protein RIF29_34760 [Crotalaria pallida]|uniref:Uncharacterized protein n=1 Tax=Crotalaria pallida TaxID=3830 RepID=A0AAN9HRD5_CROPI
MNLSFLHLQLESCLGAQLTPKDVSNSHRLEPREDVVDVLNFFEIPSAYDLDSMGLPQNLNKHHIAIPNHAIPNAGMWQPPIACYIKINSNVALRKERGGGAASTNYKDYST